MRSHKWTMANWPGGPKGKTHLFHRETGWYAIHPDVRFPGFSMDSAGDAFADMLEKMAPAQRSRFSKTWLASVKI